MTFWNCSSYLVQILLLKYSLIIYFILFWGWKVCASMFSSRIPQNILGSYASPSLNSSQALPHLCTLPTACAFALLGTTTTTTEWEHCVLAECSRAQTQLTTEGDWYTQCRSTDENRFSLSQQPSIADSFLASVWLHAHFPSTVLKSCLVWVCAVLVHARAHGHSLL